MSSDGLSLAVLAIILGIVLQLTRYAAMWRIAYVNPAYFNPAYSVVGSDVFVLLIAVSTILVASLMTRAQLIKVQVSLTHS